MGLHDSFGEQIDIRGFFYNPNIHPLLEFRKRLKSVLVLNERLKLPLDMVDAYDPSVFLKDVWNQGAPNRCERCYIQRLDATAAAAVKAGYPCFSSTLCVSTQQSHDAIKRAGERAAQKHGITFIYEDLRIWSEKTPRRSGIYRQQYCGCLFSEQERFANTQQECYRGASTPEPPSR